MKLTDEQIAEGEQLLATWDTARSVHDGMHNEISMAHGKFNNWIIANGRDLLAHIRAQDARLARAEALLMEWNCYVTRSSGLEARTGDFLNGKK